MHLEAIMLTSQTPRQAVLSSPAVSVLTKCHRLGGLCHRYVLLSLALGVQGLQAIGFLGDSPPFGLQTAALSVCPDMAKRREKERESE